MFKLFRRKNRHKHKWELVAVNDNYNTHYTDINKTQYWQMRFYQCNCGARGFTDNRDKNVKHKGMDEAKKNWVEVGVVPKNSYHPTEDKNNIKIDDIERKKIDPVLQYQKTLQDLADSLGVVINRDFDLEARYPKLKEAADEYHRQLEKYRNFENLKESKK